MKGVKLIFNWIRCFEVVIKVLVKWSDLDDKRNYNFFIVNLVKRCYIFI